MADWRPLEPSEYAEQRRPSPKNMQPSIAGVGVRPPPAISFKRMSVRKLILVLWSKQISPKNKFHLPSGIPELTEAPRSAGPRSSPPATWLHVPCSSGARKWLGMLQICDGDGALGRGRRSDSRGRPAPSVCGTLELPDDAWQRALGRGG